MKEPLFAARSKRAVWRVVAAALLLVAACPARAFISRVYSLQEVMDASTVIVEGRIQSVDLEAKTSVALTTETRKGTCVFKKIKMNIGVGQRWFPEALMKRLKKDAPVLFFYSQEKDGKLACLGHTDGIWFQLFGQIKNDAPEKVWWRFTHVEIYMNRTYAGSTPALMTLVERVVAGKAQPPPPNPDLAALAAEDLIGRGEPTVEERRQPEKPKQVVRQPKTFLLPRFKAPELDGYEAHEPWRVEPWGNPGEWTVASVAGRGKVLRVRCLGGEHGKVAVSRAMTESFADHDRLLFEARYEGSNAAALAVGFWTGKDLEFFESVPVPLARDRWTYDLQIDLGGADYKSAATDWDHKAALGARDDVRRLTFLVYGGGGGGECRIDRVRLEDGAFFVRSCPLAHAGREARGIACADYDGDGDPDALICSGQGNRLYRNDAGDFKDVTSELGLRGGSRCAGWADYDGDGDLDLFVSSLGPAPGLWENRDGKFVDRSELLPKQAGYNTEGAGWLDANGDGRPDLLLTSGEHGIYLFENTGKPPKWFRDVSTDWGLGPKGIGVENGDFVSLADFDGDGYVDFLYNVGHGLLARNEDGGRFAAVTDSGLAFETGNSVKMGVAFGDFDNDGDLDLFVPQRARSKLYRNDDGVSFEDITEKAGALARLRGKAWTAAWLDVDTDGLPDLLVGFADTQTRLFRNKGGGVFEDVTDVSGLSSYRCTWCTTGMVVTDWDQDGDEDLLLTGERTCAALLVNGYPAAARKSVPLTVRLPAAEVPGAIVRLYDSGDALCGVRQLGLPTNFSSQGPARAVFSVRAGTYKATVLRGDGTLLRRPVSVADQPVVVEFSGRQ